MNPVLQYVVRQMVEDSSAVSPASGASDEPLKALEEARQAINRLIEQSLPGIREQDQLWRAICLYADLLANFFMKAQRRARSCTARCMSRCASAAPSAKNPREGCTAFPRGPLHAARPRPGRETPGMRGLLVEQPGGGMDNRALLRVHGVGYDED